MAVVAVLVVVALLIMVVLVVVAFLIVVVLVVVAFLIVVVFRETQVVGAVFAVKFTGVFGVLSEHVDVLRCWTGQRFAEVFNHHGFVVKVFFASG